MSWPSSDKAGFTLIEMLVVISIFVITTGIVLAKLPTFRDKSSLDLVTQELATIIRQAQVYGAGTRGATGGSFPSYGIYYTPLTPSNRSNTYIILFQDLDPDDAGAQLPNHRLDGVCPGGNECVERYTLSGGLQVKETRGCISASSCSTITAGWLMIFQRPATEAFFYNRMGVSLPYTSVQFVVNNTKDPTQCRLINVWSTGHIYVDPTTTTCP